MDAIWKRQHGWMRESRREIADTLSAGGVLRWKLLHDCLVGWSELHLAGVAEDMSLQIPIKLVLAEAQQMSRDLYPPNLYFPNDIEQQWREMDEVCWDEARNFLQSILLQDLRALYIGEALAQTVSTSPEEEQHKQVVLAELLQARESFWQRLSREPIFETMRGDRAWVFHFAPEHTDRIPPWLRPEGDKPLVH